MNTFTLRPVCSEAGSVGHLVTAFLTSESIVHNFVLSKVTLMVRNIVVGVCSSFVSVSYDLCGTAAFLFATEVQQRFKVIQCRRL